MKIRTIILKVDDMVHKLLWNQKEEAGINRGADMSWEEFFLSAKNRKLK